MQGRFTSPDQPFADQYEDDPQSWNLYSYVGNNPLSFTDPFGLWKWVDPDNNGKRFIQWEEGDDWYSLSEFLYKETGRDYLPRDLEKVYSSGGLGADTIVDFSGAPSRYFTNNRGGVQDTSWDFYLTVLPAAGALKGAGGLITGAARLFTKEAVTETISLGLSTAARAATGFTTKAAARAAVEGLAASPAAKAAARKAISKATVNSTIEVVEEAGAVYVRIKRAGFDGYQVIESVIKSDGTKSVVQKAYDAAGRIVHYDPKN
jgi:hypothetical protein